MLFIDWLGLVVGTSPKVSLWVALGLPVGDELRLELGLSVGTVVDGVCRTDGKLDGAMVLGGRVGSLAGGRVKMK